MPRYTDQGSGVTIRTDGPLTPEEIDAAFAPTPENIQRFAVNEGAKLGIPAPTVLGVLGTESSGGDVNAVSPKGARGAMQVMPETAAMLQRQYGLDMEDPFQRTKGGLLYLRDQFEAHDGNPTLALAAYNAGPEAVKQYGGVPPYKETQNYVAKIPTEGWQRAARPGMPLMTDAADLVERPPSRMPLMTDAQDPYGPSKGDAAVNPDANALMLSDMAQQRNALPWYQSMPQRAVEPLAELGIQGARAVSGSDLPPLPVDRLATDVAQTAGLVGSAFPVGRLASAAIQAGAGLAAGLQTAAERHVTTGGSWEDQYKAMDATDALIIGSQVALGAASGALFPGSKSVKPFTAEGGIDNARKDLGDLMARKVAERAAPPPRTAEVAAAFGKLDRNAVVDATGWRAAVLAHRQVEGKAIPGEIKAVLQRLEPEVKTVLVPTSGIPAGSHSLMNPGPVMQAVQQPTGRYFAPVGDLLDANMALGHMVNTVEARAASAAQGHSTGNLNALRGKLTEAVMATLPKKQAALYGAARETSKDVAQNNAAMRTLERYLNPDEGILNGAGLYKHLTEGGSAASRPERLQQVWGAARYRQLLDFARSVKTITSHPEKAGILSGLLSWGGPGAAGAALAYSGAVSGPAAVGAVLGGRVLYGLATSKAVLRELDLMAHGDIGSKVFLQAAGRLALARTLLAKEISQQAEKSQPLTPVDGPTPQPSPTPSNLDALLAGAP